MGLAAKRETSGEEEEAEKRRRGRERREKRGILGFSCFIKGKYGVSVFIPGVILGIL